MNSSSDVPDRSNMARRRWSLLIGVVAIIVCAAAATLEPGAFFRAYLAGYLFYLGLGLGSMVLLMIYHLTGGSWGLVIRRILEAAMKTIPLLALLFIPIAAGIGYLYPWAQSTVVAGSPKLQYQQFYLYPTYFWIRAAIYFAIWMATALLLSRWSRKQDETGDPRLLRRFRNLSGFGAVAYGVSLHFAAVDWGMSLQPTFHSSIWGPLFATGQLVSALAFALIVLSPLVDRPPLKEIASLGAQNDLGSLLLTLDTVWAYMAWFQFMLIWIANMPVDVVWYIPRTATFWKVVIWAIFTLHFVVPFFLLLMRPIKRNGIAVARVAKLILFMQLVFLYYQVLPGAPEAEGTPLSLRSLVRFGIVVFVPLGLGGLWLAHFLWQLERQPLLPAHDYNREAALRLRRLDAEAAAREEALGYG